MGDASKLTVSYPSGEEIGLEKVPMNWTRMGEKEIYTEVVLNEDEAEHKNIKDYFLKSQPESKIESITRVQNLPLWNLYDASRTKVAVKKENEGKANEEFLFYGADKQIKGITAKIMTSGFDVQSGKISLSTRSNCASTAYSEKFEETNTIKMFLARVTLGFIGTDSNHNDDRYTITQESQLYPAYVIEFKV